ncbi:hypothetical protein [Gemmata sp.]|uniref:hypothetical protein n=1 Tax=Gemmata sp. TaxID=1914242 RepID=UPI003F6E9511
MWRLVRRWTDWVLDELLPLVRTRRSGFVVEVGYDSGGRTRVEVPVPWAADAAVVEVVLRLPVAARRKVDFALQFPNAPRVAAEGLRAEAGDRFRITFRFPVPPTSAIAELQWKHQTVAPVPVSVLTANEFLAGLSVSGATATVRLGEQAVSVAAFVPNGCKGLVATAVLDSLYPLGPLGDLGLAIEFTSERTGRTFTTPVPLTATQRAARQTLAVAVCPRAPRRPGGWLVRWRAGTRVLAAVRVEAVPARRFELGVRLLDTRFAVADETGALRVVRQPPALGQYGRVGPCFLVAGAEPGAAGVCRFAVFAVLPAAAQAVQLLEEDVVVTDAPTVFAPGLVESVDLLRISAFELRLNGRVLGTVALSPVPHATLTAEGGFKPPQDFEWSAAAEDDLMKRLGRLGG